MNARSAGALVLALPWMAFSQIAILHIQIIEGDGAVYAPGVRSQRPVTVEVTDETGRPVGGAAVTFTLPDDGPSGLFLNSLHTEVVVTDGRGHAPIRSLQLNRAPGRFQMRITAAKEQARAGTVAFQYIAENKGNVNMASSPHPGVRKRSLPKWTWLAFAAGAAAAGGLAASTMGSHGPALPPVAAAVLSPPTVAVGPPIISVGRP
jgi:hypothetical protein